MSKPVALTLSVRGSSKDIQKLVQDLYEDPDIEKVESVDALAVGEAIIIAVAAKLIPELVMRSPPAIRKFKDLIRKILKKGKTVSTGSNKTKLTFSYRMTVIEVTSGSEAELEKLIQGIIKAQKKNIG